MRAVLHRSIMGSSVKLVFIDLSGTLHVGSKPVPGAPEALSRLERWAAANGAAFRFVSNTTKESKAALVSRLQQIGFPSIRADQVLTPLQAAGDSVRSLGASNPLCFLSEESQREMGFAVDTSKPHDAVVVGLNPESFDYDRLNSAFRLLKEHNVPFIATHRGRFHRDEAGQLSLGPGPFVASLEEASGRKAITVGKPSKSFFDAAIRLGESDLSLNFGSISPSSIVMVGDDVRDDVQGARALGFQAVLVRTGKFKEEDAAGADLCLESFVEFVSWLEQREASNTSSL